MKQRFFVRFTGAKSRNVNTCRQLGPGAKSGELWALMKVYALLAFSVALPPCPVASRQHAPLKEARYDHGKSDGQEAEEQPGRAPGV